MCRDLFVPKPFPNIAFYAHWILLIASYEIVLLAHIQRKQRNVKSHTKSYTSKPHKWKMSKPHETTDCLKLQM